MNLPRHLNTQHGEEEKVISANLAENPRRAFAVLRNEGLLKFNRKKESQQDFKVVKKCVGGQKLVHCKTCKGPYSTNYFYRHARVCKQQGKPVFVGVLSVDEKNPEFAEEILGRFQNDPVGNLCRSDETVLYIGQHLFLKDKCKVDKKAEVKKSVMTDMRSLCELFLEFQSLKPEADDVALLFKRENFDEMSQAVRNVTSSGDDLKYGKKKYLYYLLLRSASILEGRALKNPSRAEGDSDAAEMSHFQKLLNHERNSLFGDATYQLNMSRQERLRLPGRIPAEDAISELKEFTVRRIKQLSNPDEMNKNSFVELRNLTCSRLTLFNARRGGEPARLKIKHWQERARWMPKPDGQNEQRLFSDMTITYGPGKGNKLVDTIVPSECVSALDILTDSMVREAATVANINDYIFASTESSISHCNGWEATHYVMKKAGIDCPELNATGQRIRISTIYAGCDVTEKEKDLFYKHMGHTEAINKGTYQCPLAEETLRNIGPILLSADQCAQNVTGKISVHVCLYLHKFVLQYA